MRRALALLALAASGPLAAAADNVVGSDCQFEGIPLHGKVQVVTSFPDIEVKVVDSFPDLKVKLVESLPDGCGEWQMVDSFPDFTIQYVESFPDVEIKMVTSFPGVP